MARNSDCLRPDPMLETRRDAYAFGSRESRAVNGEFQLKRFQLNKREELNRMKVGIKYCVM